MDKGNRFKADDWFDVAMWQDGQADYPVYMALVDLAVRMGVKDSPWVERIDRCCSLPLLGDFLSSLLVKDINGKKFRSKHNYTGEIHGLSLYDRNRIVDALPEDWHGENLQSDEDLEKFVAIRSEVCTLTAIHDVYPVAVVNGGERMALDKDGTLAKKSFTEEDLSVGFVRVPKQILRIPSAEDDGPVLKISHNLTGRKVMITKIRGGELAPIEYEIATGEDLSLRLSDLIHRHNITVREV